MPDERRIFAHHVIKHGIDGPTIKVLKIQPPLPGSNDTDCWTHAYRYAVETGADYVEGLCMVDKNGLPTFHAHAWCEEPTPFGGRRVVELTAGYEDAYNYRGVLVDLTTSFAARAEADGFRYSVLELDIAINNGRISV